MRKILALCMAFLLSAMLLCSCDTQPQEQAGTTPEASTSAPTPEANSTIPVAALSEMQIVNANASSSIVEAVKSLALMIKSMYGVEIPIVDKRASETEYEILVGDTERAESTQYLTTFVGDEDYGYSVIGKKVVIGGGSSGALIDALSAFSGDIVLLKKGGDETFFCIDWAMNYIKEHPLDQVMLNGKAISEYTVVYPKNAETPLYEALAKQIAYKVLEYSGVELTVCDDGTAYSGGYEILIGDTNRISKSENTASLTSYQGEIYAKDKLLVLRGNTLQGIASATKVFAEYMESAMDAGEKTATLNFGASQIASLDDELSVMTFNVWYTQITAKRIDRVAQNIMYAQPDIFGLQEDNTTWVGSLNTYFEGLYTRAEARDTDGERNAIYYSHEKFTLLESGTKWLSSTPDVPSKVEASSQIRTMVYAVLQRKCDGKIFLYINTHFDNLGGAGEQAKYLVSFATAISARYNNCPIFMAGDYNQTSILDPGFAHIVSQGFLNTKDEAALVLNGEYTLGPSLGDEINTICLTPDHCFVKGVERSQMKLCWVFNQRIDGQYPSDHFAVYFEYDF